MVTHNFHDHKDTKLLWVYEGLAQYLGEVLTVRSGLLNQDEYLERLASKIDFLMHQTGRNWRPLEDTAVAAYLLRGASPNWGHLRRSQDYYNEGLLLWMDADALIRSETDNQKSLDDFCSQFMGDIDTDQKTLPFDRAEIIETLNGLLQHDWADFIDQRVARVQENLPLDVVARIGYRLQYDTEPSEYIETREKDRKLVVAADSIGLEIADSGKILNVVPGMPGDQAGLAPAMEIIGVNDRKFSPQRLRDAVADSVANRKIDLLILQDDRFRNVTLDYAGGPKYLKLVRDQSKPDVLAEILKPKAPSPKK
jgi:predicted metalloprotease with PDZ domain